MHKANLHVIDPALFKVVNDAAKRDEKWTR
jgi:hypothetical protein